MAALFVGAFFLAGPFFFIAGFFSGAGIVISGMCICCAVAGAEMAPSASELAAANRIIFT